MPKVFQQIVEQNKKRQGAERPCLIGQPGRQDILLAFNILADHIYV